MRASWSMATALRAVLSSMLPRRRRMDVVDSLEKLSPQLSEVAFPQVSALEAGNIISAIMQHADFAACAKFFDQLKDPSRSLLAPQAQALLFSLIRNTQPSVVVEIGTYRAATSEAICRALQANKAGTLYTIDPFGNATVPAIVEQWPESLRRHIQFQPIDSMHFFAEAMQKSLRADIVLVDGNHDYEFALFDIQA